MVFFSRVPFSPCARYSLSSGFDFVFLTQKFKLQPGLCKDSVKRETVTLGQFIQQEARLQLKAPVQAVACDPPCHLIVNMHLGTALTLLDGAKIFAFSSGITLSQGLFTAGSIHEVTQVSRRNLSGCVVPDFRTKRWARLGSSLGPTEASDSSVTGSNVDVTFYQ